MMTRVEEFARLFQLPPAMIPHIEFVVTEQELDMALGIGAGEMTVVEIAQTMNLPLAEADAFVTRAYHRAVLVKVGVGHGHQEATVETGPTRYKVGSFYRRLDPLSMYEDWGDVPEDARNVVIEWQLQEFIRIWQPAIEEMRRDPAARARIPNRDVLLLDEALDIVDAAADHVIVPCDCRAIVRACNRPSEVCVRLDEGALMTLEAGHGRRVSKEEMKQIVIDADRAGLMHTGARDWREHELFGFCNCCACDCYPIRAAQVLGLQRVWPRSHYIAERDLATCIQCGLCARCCHFGAFYRDDAPSNADGENRPLIQFDPVKCWGCGICATACPEGAICMQPLLHTLEDTVT